MGCGWLGLPLGEALHQKGHRVKGSTTREEKVTLLESKGIQPFCIYAGAELTGESIPAFFQNDVLILNIPPGRKRPDVATFHPQQIKTIVEKAMDCGIRKVLFLSSTSVYGDSNDWVTEETKPQPITASGLALQAVENWLREQTDLEVTIVRLAGLVGGGRKAGRFLAGRKGVANGQASVNLVHRKDCIAVIMRIIEGEHWGALYNCCSDEHPTREQFYLHQAKTQGFEPPEFLQGGELHYKKVSNQKLKKELNYTFQYPDPMQF